VSEPFQIAAIVLLPREFFNDYCGVDQSKSNAACGKQVL